MASPAAQRVVSLDLIRGVAVLGILAINIAGFAGPIAATLSPDIPHAADFRDQIAFAIGFVLFEGKMRALFTILFGASLVLFVERMEASGRDGDMLQLRRLGWLMVFGYLHFLLFWWGDILFAYGLVGLGALALRNLPLRSMTALALAVFAVWHIGGAAFELPAVAAEERWRTGVASDTEADAHRGFLDALHDQAATEMVEYRSGFGEQIVAKLRERPFWPIGMALPGIGETLPLMMIGMALYRSGFLTGGWTQRSLWRMAAGCGLIGLALTLAALAWLWPRQFPLRAMNMALTDGMAFPHLLMAASYAALLVLASPSLSRTRPGQALTAAGRMAFTNYIGTTVMMTAIFYGWGAGLIGTVSRADQLAFVLLGWAAMLAGSVIWLRFFRQGPLEWAWRSLTERRRLPIIL